MKLFSTNGLLNRDRAETVYAEMVLQGVCCLPQMLSLEHEKKGLQTGKHPQQTDSSETCYLFFGFSQTEAERETWQMFRRDQMIFQLRQNLSQFFHEEIN